MANRRAGGYHVYGGQKKRGNRGLRSCGAAVAVQVIFFIFFIISCTILPLEARPHLMSAARRGDVAGIKKWLESHTVDVQDSGGHTALMWAAMKGHVEAARFMLSRRADINMRDRVGHTALMLACREDHSDVVELLLAQPGVQVNARDASRKTALIWAAKSGSVKAINVLISSGVDLDLRDHTGKTALDWAKLNEHGSIAVLLVEAGAWEAKVGL